MIKIFSKEDWIPPFADKPVFVLAPGHRHGHGAAVLRRRPVRARHRASSDLNIGLLFFLAHVVAGRLQRRAGRLGVEQQVRAARRPARRGADAQLRGLHGPVADGRGACWPARSTSRDIVEAQRGLWFCVPQFLGFVHLPDRRRRPRRAACPSTCPRPRASWSPAIHTEYSGMKFGMFFVGEYLGITLISALIATLFFGGWLGPVLPPIVWFLLKTFVFICVLHPAAGVAAAAALRPAHGLGLEGDAAAGAAEPPGHRGRRAGAQVEEVTHVEHAARSCGSSSCTRSASG